MTIDDKDYILSITSEWKGERFPNNRPRVPEGLLRRIARVTFEEAWGPLMGKGYRNQTECGLTMARLGHKLVGRAVTATMVPARPDLDEAVKGYGRENGGRVGFYNQWVIDGLEEDDVVVVDLFDKVFQGTFVGGNLSTAIRSRTVRGGAVIWGGIRDLEQIVGIEGFQVFHRGVDPSGIGEVVMTGMNAPCRVGRAICLPGDVVLGTISGVAFIPPQHAESVAVGAEKSSIRDAFGFQRIGEGRYTTAEIDTAWTKGMWDDFMGWFAADEKAAGYGHLDWEDELRRADGVKGGGSEVRV
ncbi:MAG: RraA family protein [Oscillospiraceae bacterium]|nr:RraA family protein [Oscillospiraceae bacterium]